MLSIAFLLLSNPFTYSGMSKFFKLRIDKQILSVIVKHVYVIMIVYTRSELTSLAHSFYVCMKHH